MKKRDRRPITPYSTSLTVGSGNPQKGLFDFCDAVPESTGSSDGRPARILLEQIQYWAQKFNI